MSEQDTKAHILAAATAVFAEKGFANTSMNDLVHATGLSKGGVYWHFKSKNAIVTAIFDRFFLEQLVLLDEEVLTGAGTAVTKLQQLATLTSNGVETMAAQFPSPLEFYALAARDPTLKAHLRDHFQAYRTKIGAVISEGIAAGEFRSQSSDDVAGVVMALFEGLLLIWAVAPETVDLGQQVETAVTLLLNGLRKWEP